MYCSIYKIENLYHREAGANITPCGKPITPETERILVGQGHSNCQKDPPLHQMCPICWKSIPGILEAHKSHEARPQTTP